jgi:hypothetical protein
MAKMTKEQIQARLQNAEKALQELIREFINLKDLAIGTMELAKELPGYEKALEKLKTRIKKEAIENVESKLELPDEPKLEE